jgi:hypothetical protein
MEGMVGKIKKLGPDLEPKFPVLIKSESNIKEQTMDLFFISTQIKTLKINKLVTATTIKY